MRCILILTFSLLTVFCYSQNHHFCVTHYSTANGLSSNSIYRIAQDRYGYLWLGTYDGLDRFDGYSFESFRPDPLNRYSIKTTNVKQLLSDLNGNIWLAEKKVTSFDQEKECFIEVPNPMFDDTKINALELDLDYMVDDQQGCLWYMYGSIKNDFFFYDPLHHKSRKVVMKGIDERCRCFAMNKEENTLWFQYSRSLPALGSMDITQYRKTGKAEFKIYPLPDVFKYKNIRAIDFDILGTVYISTEDMEVYKISKGTTKAVPDERINAVVNACNGKNKVAGIFRDTHGDFWIKLNDYGVIWWNPRNNISEHYLNQMSSCQINMMFEDRSGCIWFATSNGLDCINLNQKAFGVYKPNAGVPAEMAPPFFKIYENKKGNLFFSTGTGLCVYNPLEKRWQVYKTDMGRIKHIKFHELHGISDFIGDYMLFSTLAVTKIDLGRQIYEYGHPYQNDDSSFVGWSAWALLHTKSTNEFWFGTTEGLCRLRKPIDDSRTADRGVPVKMPEKFEQFHCRLEDSTTIPSDFIWSLYEDKQGVVWAGTRNGLARYKRETNSFIRYKYDPANPDGISHYKVSCMFEDNKQRFWVGTEYGLNLMDRKTGKFKRYYRKDGLPCDIIWGIIEDKRGMLWITTENGICRFDPDREIFIRYDASDGLPANSNGYRSSYGCTQNGQIFFGTVGGMVHFYPDSIKENTMAPDVIISGLKLSYRTVKIGQEFNGDVILSRSVLQTKQIELSHLNKALSIEFVGLHYVDPGKNKYAFKLEGFDENWNYVDAKMRFANYTNLKAGTYVFRVKAANCDGYWSDEGSTNLVITILPAWWETWWFRSVFIIGIVLAVGGAFIARISQVERQKKKLQHLVEEKTEELIQTADVLREVNTQLVAHQNDLQETNVLLEERQEEILSQKDEIEHQAKELKKANATQNKFFSIIGHDLKNPLFAMSSLAKMLRQEGKSMDAALFDESLDMIDASANSVTELIEDLLTWARSQTGRVEHKPVEFDLSEVVDSTIRILKMNADHKGISLRSEIQSGTKVFADRNMVTTIIRNLIGNAIKFTLKGSITVKCEASAGMKTISVVDTGIGMGDEIKEKLFRLDVNITSRGTSGEGGTGLGLIICKEFVEANKGRIWVESVPGQGSSFRFTLPDAR